MSVPTSREELKEYCLRKCGAPVIDVNLDDSQVEDAIDDALHFWREYHSSGNERTYLKYTITQQDIDNEYITLPDNIQSVRSVHNLGVGSNTASATDLFNITYQLRLHDLWDLSSVDMSYYWIARQYLSLLDDILNPELRVRFSQHTNKLNIDFNWSSEVAVGQILLIEVFQWIDPETFTEVWGDWVFRNLAAAYVKKRWGDNLNKFKEVQLPGGSSMNADGILSEAKEEIERLETDFIMKYEAPYGFYIG